MDWQLNGFYHLSTGKLAQKDGNVNLFQGICSCQARWNGKITLWNYCSFRIMCSKQQQSSGISNISSGQATDCSRIWKVFRDSRDPTLHARSPFHFTFFSARSWQAVRHSNPSSKMETSASFYLIALIALLSWTSGNHFLNRIIWVVIQENVWCCHNLYSNAAGHWHFGRDTSKTLIHRYVIWPRFSEPGKSAEFLKLHQKLRTKLKELHFQKGPDFLSPNDSIRSQWVCRKLSTTADNFHHHIFRRLSCWKIVLIRPPSLPTWTELHVFPTGVLRSQR